MTRGDIKDIPGHEEFAIALIVVAVTIGCTVGATAWQVRYPLPVALAKTAAKADKIEARVPPTYHPVRIEEFTRQTALNAELSNSPWSCARVRKAVERFGREAVEQYAKSRGYTQRQIAEAMTCLTEKKT